MKAWVREMEGGYYDDCEGDYGNLYHATLYKTKKEAQCGTTQADVAVRVEINLA
jgi:hypothetical protein